MTKTTIAAFAIVEAIDAGSITCQRAVMEHYGVDEELTLAYDVCSNVVTKSQVSRYGDETINTSSRTDTG